MLFRALIIGGGATTLLFQTTLFAQLSDEDVVRIIAIDFLLNSEPEPEITPPILSDIDDPIDIVIDGSQTSILFPNSAVNPLLNCSVIPDLPLGLSLRLVSEHDGCEIFGVATLPANVTFYRVTGENEVGISSASVVITILAL